MVGANKVRQDPDISLVLQWLDKVGLSEYKQAFQRAGIGMRRLAGLTIQDYYAVGVDGLYERRKLFELVQMVKREGSCVRPPPDHHPPPTTTPANTTKALTVCVRKRPLLRTEQDTDIITVTGQHTLVLSEHKLKVDLTSYTEDHHFYFDAVIPDPASNYDVYLETAAPLVPTVFTGSHSTCFAYGQTGSGKTHTMLGSGSEPGIYSLAAREVFARLPDAHFVTCQQYEIYGGKVFDLTNERKLLHVREDRKGNMNVCGLLEVSCRTVTDLMRTVHRASELRALGATSMNQTSSRSHAVLSINVKNQTGNMVGSLSFIDLAGSERGADTSGSSRATRMEGAAINQSLLALKECIRAMNHRQKHVPFRGSKLTAVLRHAFTGDSRTCMIACIAPGKGAAEHSLNTLRYTDRVKELKKPPQQALPAAHHEDLINTILEEEEAVIADHRQHIDEVMDLVKLEMAELSRVDRPGSSIDEYIRKVDGVLREMHLKVTTLRGKLGTFKAHLEEEEKLSRVVGSQRA